MMRLSPALTELRDRLDQRSEMSVQLVVRMSGWIFPDWYYYILTCLLFVCYIKLQEQNHRLTINY